MAEFTADLSPKNNSMSLGDMMKMGLYSAETAISQRKAQIANEEAKEMPVVMTFMKDQDKYMTNGRIDLDKASVLPVIAPFTGAKQYEKLVQLHTYRTAADEAELGLDTKQRQIVASVGETLGYAGVKDPKQYIDAYQGLKTLYPNNAHIAQLADAYSNMIGTMPPGPHIAQAAIKNSVDLLSPQTKHQMFAPQAGTAQIGGATVQTTTQPSIMGSKPTISTSQLGGGTTMEPPKTSSSLPSLISEDKNLSYTGSVNPLNLSDIQKDRYKAGQTEFDNARIIQSKQKDLQQAVRKVEEFMGSASGSKGYQMIQQGGKWIFGNSDLDSLVKNIAQVQARNAEVMGLNNNIPAQELNAKLSGSEKIDEKALAGVMQQVKAESKAVELYSEGLKKFVEKRGDINGFIQANKFQSKWSDHYDPRIFQVDNIASSNIPETEKSAKIKDITSRMSDDEFKKYKEDRVVIHRLAKGLYQ